MIQDDDSNQDDCVYFDISHGDVRNKTSVDAKGVDSKKLENVQKIVEKLTDTYHDRAMQDIKNLQISYENLINNLDNYEDKLDRFHQIAHDMKGQGASFDYHMVTYIGDYLCRFIKRIKSRPTQKILDIISIHINAMNAILVYKIRGKSDPKGDEILNGLEATLRKYAPDIVAVIRDFRKKEEKSEKENANPESDSY